MVDIVLTHSYHLRYDPKQLNKMQPYRPQGTLYAASALQQSGFSVAVFDTLLRDPEEFSAFIAATSPRLIAIYEDDFHFITKMCLSRMREVVWRFVEVARTAGIPTVIHGSDASDHPDLFMDRGIDYLLHGEAEGALVQLCEAVFSGAPTHQIRGLVQRRFGETSARKPHRPLTNPDWPSIPAPSLLLTDFAPYRDAWTRAHGYFSVNMVASRGCPYRCNWCAKPVSGNKFQLRNAEDVADEMLQLKLVAGAQHIWFSDDVFALNSRWVAGFARAVIERDARLPFQIQSRADLMTADTITALKEAGCTEVWMGVESGSQRVLNWMDKGLDLSEVREARQRLQNEGIRACYFLQFGYPGENWHDLKETINLVRQTRPDDIGISFSYPLPGTTFYSKVHKQLGLKRNWSDSDDLQILFHGAYTTAFYRAVRNALHAEVDGWSSPSPTKSLPVEELWLQVEQMEPASRLDPVETIPQTSTFVTIESLLIKAGA